MYREVKKYLKQIKLNNLVIIGGSGFIGKSIMDSFNRGLLKKYLINKLIIICRKKIVFKNKKKINFKNIKVIYSDIRKIKKLPKSNLYIYASETTKIDQYKNTKKIVTKHKESINNFCELIKEHPNVKVLYLSSGVAEKKYLNNSKIGYKKIYSFLKNFSENKIKLLKKYKINTSIARCYTFIGPFLPTNEHFAIGNFLSDAKYKKKITINSRNLVYRSYMYADDMVDWLLAILIFAKKNTKIYNVGSDCQIELRQLALLISKFCKGKTEIISKSLNSKKVDRYVPNINKTKNDFNLKIKYNLTKSIKSTFHSI